MRRTLLVISALLLVAATATARADDLQLSKAEFLEQYSATNAFSLGRPVRHTVVDDGTTVLFLRSQPRSFVHDLWQFDCETGEERVLLTADAILQGAEEHLTAEEKARRERVTHEPAGHRVVLGLE